MERKQKNKFKLSRKDFWKDIIISALTSVLLTELGAERGFWLFEKQTEVYFIVIFQMWIIMAIIVEIEEKLHYLIKRKLKEHTVIYKINGINKQESVMAKNIYDAERYEVFGYEL